MLDLRDTLERRPDTIVLVDLGRMHARSTAALSGRVYGIVARNRYRWVGKRDHCMMPAPGLGARLSD